jgi:hypothetical protein
MDITTFRDKYATTAKRVPMDWEKLVEHVRNPAKTYPSKADCPLLKLATFGTKATEAGCLRHDGNIETITGVEGDYDGEVVPITDAAQMMADAHIECVLYTSPSHTPQAPRWRVLVPLSKPCAPAARAAYLARVNGVLGGILGPESFTLSQSYYIGRVAGAPYQMQQIRGEFVDCLDGLPEIYPKREPVPGATGADGKIANGGRNRALTSNAGAMRYRGMPVEAIRAALLIDNATRCDPPLPEAEVEKIAASIGRKPVGNERAAGDAAPQAGLQIIGGEDVVMEAISWLWQDWIAAGVFHVLAGTPGCGKTTVALAWAATITSGGRWPDGTRADVGNVLIWSGEDGIGDTLAPRLKAMGANMGRVKFVGPVLDAEHKRAFDPAVDMDALLLRAAEIGDVRFLLLDPIVQAVSGDDHKNGTVRRSLAPVVEFCQAIGCAVVGISHFSKGTQGREPVDRVTGSLAFAALPRVVVIAGMNRDGEGSDRQIIAKAKCNIGPRDGGFVYSLEQIPLTETIAASAVRWGESLTGNARDLLASGEADPEEASAAVEAADWLREALANGPIRARQGEKDAKELGFALTTVRRARKALGIGSRRVDGLGDKGFWLWEYATAKTPTVGEIVTKDANVTKPPPVVPGKSGVLAVSDGGIADAPISPSNGVLGGNGVRATVIAPAKRADQNSEGSKANGRVGKWER